ncbi:hypothetical protein ACNOYE_13720 [Nannocystaceae bacterium ST9]
MADVTTESVKNNLRGAINSLVELRIVTYVGAATLVGGDQDGKLKIDVKLPALTAENGIVTAINLTQGDISNLIPEQFWTPEKAAVLAYHQEQVKAAKEIVDRNLKLMAEVGGKLLEMLGK